MSINVRFISYSKCSNWRRISKLSLNFECLFTFCYLDGANSIKTDLHICNLWTGQFVSYKSGILFHIKCLSLKLPKCIYSNLQPSCLVVRRLSTFTYWCIKMNRSSLNFSPSNQYIFLLFLLPFDKWIKHWKKKSLNIVMITVQKIPNHFFL